MRTFGQISLLVTRDLDQRQKLVDQSVTFDDNHATTAAEFTSQIVTLAAEAEDIPFDFSTFAFVFGDMSVTRQVKIEAALTRYCKSLYRNQQAYTREGLMDAVKGL